MMVAGSALVLATSACADAAEDATPAAPTTASSTSTTSISAPTQDEADRFPRIVNVQASPDGDETWGFDVTISSPYDTPERYADAWRVLDDDGNQLGIRVLAHDHAAEQPFTRSLAGVPIPADVTTVHIEARDLINGWSGETVAIDLEEQPNG